jgi:heme A synthase
MPVLPARPAVHPMDKSAGLQRRFPGFAWFVLGYNVAVVLEGAFVRATGSGGGCGNHWPLCNGQVVFGTPALATVIEFAHRAMTGVDGALILAVLAWSFRAFPKHHPARLGAAVSTLFLLSEALIGAALVKFGLVVNDASPARAAVLSLHLANTLTLLACLTLTAWWATHPRIRLSGQAWASLAAVAVLGITGALAALADTLYPVHSLAAGFAQDLSPDANFVVRLRAMHPFVAAAVGLWVMYYAAWRAPGARKAAQTVIALVVTQLLAGALNLLLLTPIGMQLVHLLLADLLWIALVVLCASPDSP